MEYSGILGQCIILELWIYVITHLSKSTECITRVNPYVNSGLWVIMICQGRFMNCNKCIPLVGDVDNGGGYVSVEAQRIWEICRASSFIFLEHF